MTDIFKNRDWTPMTLKESFKPFDNDDYIFEVKYDGIRALLFASSKGIEIQSRNGKSLTQAFPELQSAIKTDKNVIIDGEIIILEGGKPSFPKVLNRIQLKNRRKIQSSSHEQPVIFIAFDILYENGDLTSIPLLERKKILNKYRDNDVFSKITWIEKDGIKLFKSIKKLGLEGIVAKKKDGLYHIGKRTFDFIKIKNIHIDKFIIGGYEIKKNGLLTVAFGEMRNGILHYAGKVTMSRHSSLYEEVLNLEPTSNHFVDFDENIVFVEPKIHCYIEYLERTQKGLRHPSLKECI